MTYVVGSPVWAERKRLRHLGSFALFFGAAVIGGALTGVLLGTLLPNYDHRQFVFALIATALLIREWLRLPIPLPQIRLQVPEALKTHRRVGPPTYGLILGSGVLTYLPSSVVYVYILSLILLVSPVGGAAIGGAFGGTYALAVLVLGRETRRLAAVQQAGWLKQLFANARPTALLLTAMTVVVIGADEFMRTRGASAGEVAVVSCRPSPASPLGGDRLAPEVRGSFSGGSLWALFFLPGDSRWPDKNRAIFARMRGNQVKIVFHVTGSGRFKVSARSPSGTLVRPRWGPEPHQSSTWNRPGREWGTGFVFGRRGCWKLEVQRGRRHGRVAFVVRS
jgi:sulfite exporter TauE/SafE